jgi:hypothetical protein
LFNSPEAENLRPGIIVGEGQLLLWTKCAVWLKKKGQKAENDSEWVKITAEEEMSTGQLTLSPPWIAYVTGGPIKQLL